MDDLFSQVVGHSTVAMGHFILSVLSKTPAPIRAATRIVVPSLMHRHIAAQT